MSELELDQKFELEEDLVASLGAGFGSSSGSGLDWKAGPVGTVDALKIVGAVGTLAVVEAVRERCGGTRSCPSSGLKLDESVFWGSSFGSVSSSSSVFGSEAEIGGVPIAVGV